MPFKRQELSMRVQTEAGAVRREQRRERRELAKASWRPAEEVPHDAVDSLTVWRSGQLPEPRTARAGVPLSEGVVSVFAGAIAYIPIALFSGWAVWNYPVAAVLTVALSYALWSRQVVVGPEFLAVRKFGPFRLATAASITRGALTRSQRGGVLKLKTGDGRTMRLRRVEFSDPEVNQALRAFVLRTGRPYDEDVMLALALPFREEFGHHRYLLDAVQ